MNNIDFYLMAALLTSLKNAYENAKKMYTSTGDSKFMTLANMLNLEISSVLYNTWQQSKSCGVDNVSDAEALYITHDKNKIAAIKAWRERTGGGLAEGKKVIEEWMMKTLGVMDVQDHRVR